jgi:hypothetical protein
MDSGVVSNNTNNKRKGIEMIQRLMAVIILVVCISSMVMAQVPDTLGRTFTTAPAPMPGVVTLLAPENNFHLMQSDPLEHSSIILSWQSAENAEEYELWVSYDGVDYITEVFTQDTSYELPLPFAVREYRWTVRGVNQWGVGEWAINFP